MRPAQHVQELIDNELRRMIDPDADTMTRIAALAKAEAYRRSSRIFLDHQVREQSARLENRANDQASEALRRNAVAPPSSRIDGWPIPAWVKRIGRWFQERPIHSRGERT